MIEFLKSCYGKIVMTALTAASAVSTVAVNLQQVNLSQVFNELCWWVAVLGGLIPLLASGLFLGLVLLRGRRLLETERLARMLCYASAFVVIGAGLALSGWAIVQAGLLPWVAAEIAILLHLAGLAILIRRWIGKPRA